MTPKDWIIYVDPEGETRASVQLFSCGLCSRSVIESEGNKIIGYVSSGSEADAIKYGNEVLRKD